MNAPAVPPGSTELTQLQRWFQTVVTHAEGIEAGACSDEAQRLIQLAPGELERVVTRSRALSAAERLAIYANAYHSRLLECLGEVFPMLKRTLGEEAFEGLAFGYLQDYPSRTYTLNELGRHFPQYLEQTHPGAADTEGRLMDSSNREEAAPILENWADFLIDLARLEWAIYDVFDGPGVEGTQPFCADDLLAIPPESWEQATLIPVVCLQLLATRFPVNDYFTALRRSKPEEPVAIPEPSNSFVALMRRNFVVRRYNLSKSEFRLLRALQDGRSVGQAIESITTPTNNGLDELAAQLQLWFRNWTAEGFFQSVSLEHSS